MVLKINNLDSFCLFVASLHARIPKQVQSTLLQVKVPLAIEALLAHFAGKQAQLRHSLADLECFLRLDPHTGVEKVSKLAYRRTLKMSPFRLASRLLHLNVIHRKHP